MKQQITLGTLPDHVLTKAVTPIPTKTVVVNDWDALHLLLLSEGFIVIESEEIRTLNHGGVDCAPVKAFVAYMNIRRGVKISTKRIGKHRWVLAVKE